VAGDDDAPVAAPPQELAAGPDLCQAVREEAEAEEQAEVGEGGVDGAGGIAGRGEPLGHEVLGLVQQVAEEAVQTKDRRPLSGGGGLPEHAVDGVLAKWNRCERRRNHLDVHDPITIVLDIPGRGNARQEETLRRWSPVRRTSEQTKATVSRAAPVRTAMSVMFTR
jgi:hypothetical protein